MTDIQWQIGDSAMLNGRKVKIIDRLHDGQFVCEWQMELFGEISRCRQSIFGRSLEPRSDVDIDWWRSLEWVPTEARWSGAKCPCGIVMQPNDIIPDWITEHRSHLTQCL